MSNVQSTNSDKLSILKHRQAAACTINDNNLASLNVTCINSINNFSRHFGYLTLLTKVLAYTEKFYTGKYEL